MEPTIKIVLAEDSKVQALLLRRALEEAGFEVEWAENGLGAFKLVKEFKPNILISDVEMPEMDGYSLCRKIKDTPETQSTPVLLLTTLRKPTDILRGLSSGADVYLTKPYDPLFLISRIKYILKSLHIQDDVNKPLLVKFKGQQFHLDVERAQLLNLLLATYENIVMQNKDLANMRIQLEHANEMVENSLKYSEESLKQMQKLKKNRMVIII